VARLSEALRGERDPACAGSCASAKRVSSSSTAVSACSRRVDTAAPADVGVLGPVDAVCKELGVPASVACEGRMVPERLDTSVVAAAGRVADLVGTLPTDPARERIAVVDCRSGLVGWLAADVCAAESWRRRPEREPEREPAPELSSGSGVAQRRRLRGWLRRTGLALSVELGRPRGSTTSLLPSSCS